MATPRKKKDSPVIDITPGASDTKAEAFSLARIETPELLQPIVKEYGLELADEKVDMHLRRFVPFVAQLVDLEKELTDLLTGEITPELSTKAKDLRGKYRDIRTGSNDTKATDKREMVVEGRFLDKLDNAITDGAKLKEAKCLEIEKHLENIEAERVATLKQDRKEKLEALDYDTEFLNLAEMTEDSFNRLVAKAEQNKQGADALAEQKRKEQETQAAEDEKKRLHQERGEARMRKLVGFGMLYNETTRVFEAEGIGKVDYDVVVFHEDEVFNKEAAKFETAFNTKKKAAEDALQVEREAKQRVTNRINAVTKLGLAFDTATEVYVGHGQKFALASINDLTAEAFKDELDRVTELVNAAKKKVSDAQKKKDDELKALQVKENERKAAETKKVEDARLAALAPDKDKFKAFYASFKEFKAPELSSEAGKQLTVTINQEFEAMKKRLIALAKNLK